MPSPQVVSCLIEDFGCAGEMDKANYLYGIVQNIISLLGTASVQNGEHLTTCFSFQVARRLE